MYYSAYLNLLPFCQDQQVVLPDWEQASHGAAETLHCPKITKGVKGGAGEHSFRKKTFFF